MSHIEKCCLYVVATPIGNLDDITARAIAVLSGVDAIAAEDTRHSRTLLQHLGIDTPMFALHEHNESDICEKVIQRIHNGEGIALISDAGTPLVSDPGFILVREARRANIRIIPVPGVSSIIAALSCSGLPTDRFVFEGFLPAKKGTRQNRLLALEKEARTLIFFEAPHRIIQSLQDIEAVFGGERQAVLARELTKTWETILDGSITQLLVKIHADSNQCRGEMVLMVAGSARQQALDDEALRLLEILMQELPLKQASTLAAKFTGLNKKLLYQAGLKRKENNSP